MKRPVFSFRPNLEMPEHRKAWEILNSVPVGQKNRFLVQVILQGQETASLEEVVRRAVREELRCDKMTHDGSSDVKEIPNQMLDFLFQMEDNG